MKLTWRRPSGQRGWHAYYYPQGRGILPAPFLLSVLPATGDFPWAWQVQRDEVTLAEGQSTDAHDAQIAAHSKLAHFIRHAAAQEAEFSKLSQFLQQA